LFQKVYKIAPSSRLNQLYYSALESEPILDSDYAPSSKPLSFHLDSALVCNPDVFRQMLVVDRNRNERENKATYIIRITLQFSSLPNQNPDKLNKTILLVQQLLVHSLRSCDIVTRWNDNTLLAILGGSDEIGIKVGCERIRSLIANEMVNSLTKVDIEKLPISQVSFPD